MKVVILLAQAGERRSSFPISNSFFGARLVEAKAMPKLLFLLVHFARHHTASSSAVATCRLSFFLRSYLVMVAFFHHARLRPLDSPLLGLIAGIK